jgi:hypothetical protein
MSKSNMLQLDPPIPVTSPKGKAQAIGWLDYSPEHHLLWIVAQDSNGEIWIWPNHQIRMRNNPTMERNLTEENYYEID